MLAADWLNVEAPLTPTFSLWFLLFYMFSIFHLVRIQSSESSNATPFEYAILCLSSTTWLVGCRGEASQSGSHLVIFFNAHNTPKIILLSSLINY